MMVSRVKGYVDIIRATQLIHYSPGMLFIITCLARPSPSFIVTPPDTETAFLQLARSVLMIGDRVELMASARLSCRVSRVRPLPWMPCWYSAVPAKFPSPKGSLADLEARAFVLVPPVTWGVVCVHGASESTGLFEFELFDQGHNKL
jgi:hypothetical protein